MHKIAEFDGYFYNTKGELTEQNDPDVCAKHLISNHTGNHLFYIKRSSFGFYNPNVRLIQYNKANWKFLKVQQVQFELYIKFLTSHKETYLTQAERLI